MSKKKKPASELTPWQRHVRKMGSVQAAADTWDKKTGKPKAKSKKKAKAKTKVKKPVSKKKDAPKKRRRGPLERKSVSFAEEFDDIRRALNVEKKDSHFKWISGTWRLRIGVIKIKRMKLTDAMRDLRSRARKRL